MSELSRLRWLCRRGMKELDLVLARYLENHYPTAGDSEQTAFRKLLELQDPELYRLILGKQMTDEPDIAEIVRIIRSEARTAG